MLYIKDQYKLYITFLIAQLFERCRDYQYKNNI